MFEWNFIDGSDADDFLFGTPGADFIVGGNGDDMLRGLAGPDALVGGPGNDHLSGDADFSHNPEVNDKGTLDRLHGGGGDDVLEVGGRGVVRGQRGSYANGDGNGDLTGVPDPGNDLIIVHSIPDPDGWAGPAGLQGGATILNQLDLLEYTGRSDQFTFTSGETDYEVVGLRHGSRENMGDHFEAELIDVTIAGDNNELLRLIPNNHGDGGIVMVESETWGRDGFLEGVRDIVDVWMLDG